MTKAKATKTAAEKASGDDPKVVVAANELRKQGATFAIIAHTLGIPYARAVVLGKAYDKAHGNHEPAKLVRTADGVKLAGYQVRDGGSPASAKKTKASKATIAKASPTQPKA